MPNYKRFKTQGGCYFFTVNLAQRGGNDLVTHIDALRRAYGNVMARLPFRTDAIVILPDHIHAIWTLPAGDADFSTRWKEIKAQFSHAIGPSPRSYSKRRKGELGLWQRRFWEHLIRDAQDFRSHIAYIRNDPVKHGWWGHRTIGPLGRCGGGRRVGATHRD